MATPRLTLEVVLLEFILCATCLLLVCVVQRLVKESLSFSHVIAHVASLIPKTLSNPISCKRGRREVVRGGSFCCLCSWILWWEFCV